MNLFNDFRRGKINRRQLIQALGAGAGVAFAASALPNGDAFAAGAVADVGKAFPPDTVNHLALSVADYKRSRDWYVDLFGMRVAWDDGKQCALEFGSLTSPNGIYIRPVSKPTDRVGVGHIAFGIKNFAAQRDAMKAEMERRSLKGIRPDGEKGWIAYDPAGYMLNTWVPVKDPAMYPGAAGPCPEAASAACKAGWAAGQENLPSIPKPSGTGFTALYFSHIVINVHEADLVKERDFYSGMYGMKVIYEKLDGPSPQIFLRFGENTLYLRKIANPSEEPWCNHYAFVIKDYDQAKVKAKLKSRGLKPEPDSKLGWSIKDPNGMRLEVAGPGLPEHIFKDCKGAAPNCPGGPTG